MLCPDFHELGKVTLTNHQKSWMFLPIQQIIKKVLGNSGNFLGNYVDTIWWSACFIAENALLHIHYFLFFLYIYFFTF